MYLSKEEEALLNGERGEAKAKALKALIEIGEALGAERLVNVEWVHISGISYKNIGDSGLKFIKELVEYGAFFSVRTTLNPAGMDLNRWQEMGIPEAFAYKQLEVTRALISMGAEPTFSCVPYLLGSVKEGSQVAWGESNAVLYANSVLGALTNREASVLTLLEAITGKAPLIGLRLREFRKPTVLVEFDSRVLREVSKGNYPYSLLGYCLGKVVERGVPYLRGFKIPKRELKNFLAGLGASSSIGLIIIEGLSPDAKYLGSEDLRGLDKVSLSSGEVEECKEEFYNALSEVDAVVLGCPHLSEEELREILEVLKYAKRRPSDRLILFTSKPIGRNLKRKLESLRGVGAELYFDTCMVVCPLRYMNIRSVATDSAKAAYYLSSQGVKVLLLPRRRLLGI
ncbi:MAG: hypothetical protein B6U69_00065 [Thermofilum sp. ex4484_15]|nr:MAG: hypothetical protein B6U69_00065 [Thermofilum sp. ex4484_15]